MTAPSPQLGAGAMTDGPRKAVSYQKMSLTAEVGHWTMIVITAGLWTPVYLAARRKRKTVTYFR